MTTYGPHRTSDAPTYAAEVNVTRFGKRGTTVRQVVDLPDETDVWPLPEELVRQRRAINERASR